MDSYLDEVERIMGTDIPDSKRPVITRYHNTKFYPQVLFEFEAKLPDGRIVFCNFEIEPGFAIMFGDGMEFWSYDKELFDVCDLEESAVDLGEFREMLLEEGIRLWNKSPLYNENWRENQ